MGDEIQKNSETLNTPEIQKIPKRDKLQEVIPFIFYYEPFFADVFRYINKIKALDIATAAVAVNKDAEIDMYYNPVFVNGLNLSEIYFLIKHEIYHVLLSHIFERNRKEYPKLYNIITDMIINRYVQADMVEVFGHCVKKQNLDIEINYESLKEGEFIKKIISVKSIREAFIQIKKTNYMDYYTEESIINSGASEKIYDLFLKHIKDGYEDSKNKDTLDDHNYRVDEALDEDSENFNKAISDIAKEKFKKQVEEIVKESNMRGYGNIPYSLRDIINNLMASKTVDWRILLNYFIKQTIRGHKYNSIRKINKRFPYIHSGQKHRKYARVLVGMDESGSMSDELINMLFSEIKGLSEVVQFDVIPFDVDIEKEGKFTWKKGMKINCYKRYRRGGTSFDPITKYASENKYDGLIIVTDCGAPLPPSYGVKRMWLTDKEGMRYCHWAKKELVVMVNK